ncbi:hypothetical protein X975_16163, partial [Stegodyphus mimosarum]
MLKENPPSQRTAAEPLKCSVETANKEVVNANLNFERKKKKKRKQYSLSPR